MKAGWRGGWTLVAVLVALTVPAAAAAKPGYRVVNGAGVTLLGTGGSHDYRIMILASRDRVSLIAVHGLAVATYSVRGLVETDRIQARFGRLGRISVRFHPKGKPHADEIPGCKGRPPRSLEGTFTGLLGFHGERGFTSTRRSRVAGSVQLPFHLVCKQGRRRLASSIHSNSVSLRAESRSASRLVAFTADKTDGEAKQTVSYSASVVERRPGMEIFRQAFATGSGKSFAVSRPGEPTLATVAPGGLLAGKATFEHPDGGEASWTGDLAAEVPGLGRIALAGPSFHAALCRDSSCACNHRTPCVAVEEVPHRRLLAHQGSGSHSHPFADARLSWSR